MLLSEFVNRTGFMPTSDEYSALEKLYYDWKGDKDDFCAHFVKNKSAMLTKAREIACASFEEERTRMMQTMHAAQNECERMKTAHQQEMHIAKLKHEQTIALKDGKINDVQSQLDWMRDNRDAIRKERDELAQQVSELTAKVNALKLAIKTIKE